MGCNNSRLSCCTNKKLVGFAMPRPRRCIQPVSLVNQFNSNPSCIKPCTQPVIPSRRGCGIGLVV